MAGAEALEIAGRIDQNVIHMGTNIAGMTGQLQGTHAEVQDVGQEVC
jgi:hypothetical protein